MNKDRLVAKTTDIAQKAGARLTPTNAVSRVPKQALQAVRGVGRVIKKTFPLGQALKTEANVRNIAERKARKDAADISNYNQR